MVNGYRARFYKAQELFDELYASLADRSTSRLLNRLARYDALLIDELGYLTLKPEQVNAFFKLLDMRYGHRPTLITTNWDYPDWYELFQRKPLVDALLDRLQGPPLRQAPVGRHGDAPPRRAGADGREPDHHQANDNPTPQE